MRALASLSGAELVAKLAAFLLSLYLARTLGAAQFGEYAVIIAAVSYPLLLVGPGFDLNGSRIIARQPDSGWSVLRVILGPRAVVALAAYVVTLAICALLQLDSSLIVLIAAQGMTVLLAAASTTLYFQGLRRFGIIALQRGLTALLGLLFTVVLVTRPGDLPAAIWSAVVATACGTLFAWGFVNQRPHSASGDVEGTHTLLRDWWAVTWAYLMILVYFNSDILFLRAFRSASESGIYAAAYRPVLLLLAFPGLFWTALFPTFAAASEGEQRRALAHAAIRWLGWVGAVLCGAGILAADWILNVLYGPAYAGGDIALQILLGAALIAFVNVGVANPLVAWDRQRDYSWIVTTAALVNLILNIVLIPRYGMTAAACTTVAAEITVFAAAAILQRRLYGIDALRALCRPWGTGSITLLALVGLNHVVPILGPLNAALYVIVLLLVAMVFDKRGFLPTFRSDRS